VKAPEFLCSAHFPNLFTHNFLLSRCSVDVNRRVYMTFTRTQRQMKPVDNLCNHFALPPVWSVGIVRCSLVAMTLSGQSFLRKTGKVCRVLERVRAQWGMNWKDELPAIYIVLSPPFLSYFHLLPSFLIVLVSNSSGDLLDGTVHGFWSWSRTSRRCSGKQ